MLSSRLNAASTNFHNSVEKSYSKWTVLTIFLCSFVLTARAAFAVESPYLFVVMGASTGGPDAFDKIFEDFNEAHDGGVTSFPPIVIVLHGGTPSTDVSTWNSLYNPFWNFKSVPSGGESLADNTVYFAPFGTHIQITSLGGGSHKVEYSSVTTLMGGSSSPQPGNTSPQTVVVGWKPSVDVLFDSVAATAGSTEAGEQMAGYVLTGQGKDGRDGLYHMNNEGCHIAVQSPNDEFLAASSMPEEALEGSPDAVVLNAGQIFADILGIPYGDANYDGAFNSTDLVIVFQNGEFEDQYSNNSTWKEGDWTGDREFTEADLDLAEPFYSGGNLLDMPDEEREAVIRTLKLVRDRKGTIEQLQRFLSIEDSELEQLLKE